MGSVLSAFAFRDLASVRGETYTYDEGKTLRPGEVKHVDLRRLRDEQIPGENEVTLPPDLTSGQVKAQIHNDAGENLKLVGQAVLTDPGGRAAAMSCPVCPPDPHSLSLSPSSFTGNIGTSQQIFPRIHWADALVSGYKSSRFSWLEGAGISTLETVR